MLPNGTSAPGLRASFNAFAGGELDLPAQLLAHHELNDDAIADVGLEVLERPDPLGLALDPTGSRGYNSRSRNARG